MEGQMNRSGWMTAIGMAISGAFGGVIGYIVGKSSDKSACACKASLPEGTKQSGNGNGSNGDGKKA